VFASEVALTNEAYPTAVLLDRVVIAPPVYAPIRVFPTPVVAAIKASLPKTVFWTLYVPGPTPSDKPLTVVFPLITGVVIVGLVARTTEPEPVPVIAPPRVRLPELVTVPLRVNPLTVPVPLTEVTVPPPPPPAY
jgi:hypothetical protein